MKLNEEKMDIIAKADKLTGCYSSTTEETHFLNEEEAYSLIESFVEILDTPLNDQINELNNKLDAQDKIINEQALEIARLKDNFDFNLGAIENLRKTIKEQEERIDKAIEYISNVLCNSKAMVRNDISGKEIDELLEILGDKENE